MAVTLQKNHENLLREEVAAGRFASIDEAVAFALDHFLPGDLDDLAWLRADLDAARGRIAPGAHQTIADYRAKLEQRLSRMTSA